MQKNEIIKTRKQCYILRTVITYLTILKETKVNSLILAELGHNFCMVFFMVKEIHFPVGIDKAVAYVLCKEIMSSTSLMIRFYQV